MLKERWKDSLKKEISIDLCISIIHGGVHGFDGGMVGSISEPWFGFWYHVKKLESKNKR